MKRNISETMFKLMDELDMFPETTMITIQRKDLERLVNEMFFKGDEWSNHSALGYAIEGAKSMELTDGDINLLVTAMNREFEEKTLEVAAEVYRQSSYKGD